MQRIAAVVGFSETAFVAPARGGERTIRYYSPFAEVSFCGHATIATGVVLGTRLLAAKRAARARCIGSDAFTEDPLILASRRTPR